jgi:hypothetical protein
MLYRKILICAIGGGGAGNFSQAASRTPINQPLTDFFILLQEVIHNINMRTNKVREVLM